MSPTPLTNIFKLIFYLGVIHIVFSTIWKVLATLFSSLLKDAGVNKDYSFLFFKSLGYYILISISALVTYDMILQANTFMAVIYGLLGVFIIYTTVAGNLERNRWRAVMNFERKRIQVMRYDGLLLIASLLLFLATLMLPQIAENPVNSWFRKVIDDIYHLPVVGWVIKIAAAIYMISIIVKGIKTTDYILSIFSGKKRKSPSSTKPFPEEEYADYEEIEE